MFWQSGASPQDARYSKEVICRDRIVPVIIHRTRRKTMALHVFADRPVELRVPLKCAWVEIEGFLESRREWIADSLDQLAVTDLPSAPGYVDGELHHFLGRAYRLQRVSGKRNNVSLVSDVIAVRCSRPEEPNRIRAVLEGFYRSEARRLFPERASLCLARLREQLPPPRVTVRKMRARWGSCSRDGEICLNTLLMQKPIAAIDFVVMHELCHLKHFSHNRSFYHLLDQAMPDWREREKLLSSDKVCLQFDLF